MQLNRVQSFACYYGPAESDRLANYDLVIVQPEHYAPDQVALLRSRGVVVIAYLSIGYEPAPGLGVNWHIANPDDGMPLHDPRWDTLYVDCRSPAWQTHVLQQRIPEILARGVQGLFLDNLDVQETHPQTRPGVIDLVRRIRRGYPDLALIANRGFSALDSLTAQVDAALFEAFTTYHDGERYSAWPDADLAWTEAQVKRLRGLRPDWPILALDYAAPHDRALRARAEERARAHGLFWFASTWALDWLPDG